MARKSNIANVSIDEGAGTITFAFTNGRTTVVDPFTFAPDVQRYATLHGINQKLRDSYAGSESLGDAIAAFDKTLETLASGKWSSRGEGEGAPVGAFAEAFHLFLVESGRIPADTPRSKTKEILGKLDPEKKKALRNSDQIVKILARLAQAKATTNADDILAGVEVAVA